MVRCAWHRDVKIHHKGYRVMFFTKKDIGNFMYYQLIPFYILYIFGCLLEYKKRTPLDTLVSLYVITFWSYFIHRILHVIPESLNIHNIFHHYHDTAFNLVIELLFNIFMFVLFYYIQIAVGVYPVSNIILLYYTIVYVSGHIINYSIFSVRNHQMHHKTAEADPTTPPTPICNYGPDVYDHFFGTNYDECWENYMHIVPNITMAFFICYYIQEIRPITNGVSQTA